LGWRGEQNCLCSTLIIRSTAENYIQLLVTGVCAEATGEEKMRWKKEMPWYVRVRTSWGDGNRLETCGHLQVRTSFMLQRPPHQPSFPRKRCPWEYCLAAE